MELVNQELKIYFLRTFGYSGSNGASDNTWKMAEGIDPLKNEN